MEHGRSFGSRATVIDVSYLREVSESDSAFESELLSEFLEVAQVLAGQIEASLGKCDCEGLRYAAHTLKGSGRAIGANILGDICLAFELAARNADLKSVEKRMPEIWDQLRQIEAFARSYFRRAA